jgi:arylsulfatase A-like enzyme
MIPPQLPGSPSYLRPGTPAVAKFLFDLGYTTGQFGKNHCLCRLENADYRRRGFQVMRPLNNLIGREL